MTFTSETFKRTIHLYSDGADKKTLLEMNDTPWISGMTTNPSLMKKAGISDYPGFCKEILSVITKKPISFEVFADDLAGMESQARIIATWGKNVFVKIPVINSEGQYTGPVIRSLAKSGIPLNVTAVYSVKQTLDICKDLDGGARSIVSLFAGRLADVGIDPLPISSACAEICRTYEMDLLWASTREVYNVVQAQQTGCTIITAPADILKKLSGFGQSPLQLSQDTVKTFKKDSEAAGFKL